MSKNLMVNNLFSKTRETGFCFEPVSASWWCWWTENLFRSVQRKGRPQSRGAIRNYRHVQRHSWADFNLWEYQQFTCFTYRPVENRGMDTEIENIDILRGLESAQVTCARIKPVLVVTGGYWTECGQWRASRCSRQRCFKSVHLSDPLTRCHTTSDLLLILSGKR